MKVSQIANHISESVTLKLNARAARLRREGVPVIHLGGGEPKGKAPKEAINAGIELLKTGEIRYTPASGTKELKEAILIYTEDFYKLKLSPQNVVASSGAKQAIMVALQAVVNPYEEVIFPAPYWVSYPEMIKICRANPIPVYGTENRYIPTLEDIKRKVTKFTKAVIINSPNNPTGLIYPREFIKGIVEFCEENNLYLIMDDIYHRLIFDESKRSNCMEFLPDSFENSKLILVNGVSKMYAMTGFRIGWAIANEELADAMNNIQAHQTSNPCTISQKAAAAVLFASGDHVKNLKKSLAENRIVLLKKLNEIENLKFEEPEGTFYCLVDFSEYEKDSTKLAEYLIEEAKVITIPGIEFGMEGHLRLSYCNSSEEIEEGIERIKQALNKYGQIKQSEKELFLSGV